MATSLDGFIATPEGGIDWLSQIETPEIETPEEDYGYGAFYAKVDALVMGRRTYHQVRSFGNWLYPDKPAYVVIHRPWASDLPKVSATAQAPIALVHTLQQQGCRRVWLVGGAALAAAFRAEGLIDEYILSVIPVLLGAGIPIFARPGPAASVGPGPLRPLPAEWCGSPTGSPNNDRQQKPGAMLNESLQGEPTSAKSEAQPDKVALCMTTISPP